MTPTIPRSTSNSTWLGAALGPALALGLTLAACGMNSSSAPGQAFTDASIAGSIVLYDSSLPMQARTAPMAANGAFSIQTTGLTPPYLLRAEWFDEGTTRQRYGVSEGDDNVDINGFTDTAYWAACEGKPESQFFKDSDAEGKRGAAERARALLTRLLQSPLAPLFRLYGVADHRADRAAVRRLLADVSVSRSEGVLTVTNRATGLTIFVGQVGDLANGTFTAANLPPGPTAPTCTAFTYSDFAACQPDNTQVRTVLTSSPPGCAGGSPLTTQPCTYVPPGNTCTAFTYSPYGPCLPNNTQVRTVLTSRPAGCTGGSPLTTQACTYVPPVTTCTAFTYSPYGACLPNNTQVRTVLTSSPAGCSGGSPLTTRACTYVAPCTLATAVPSCTTCHGALGSGGHVGRAMTCATCHGPVDNGAGKPSRGMSAALSGSACRLTYPTSRTHGDETINFGAAE